MCSAEDRVCLRLCPPRPSYESIAHLIKLIVHALMVDQWRLVVGTYVGATSCWDLGCGD